MRIISKFQDYYDGGQVYGTEPGLVYVRTDEQVPLVQPFLSEVENIGKQLPRQRDYRLNCMPTLIGFCGKIYLAYRLDADIFQPNRPTWHLTTHLYGPEDFSRYFSSKPIKRLAPNFFEKGKAASWRSPRLRWSAIGKAYEWFHGSRRLEELFHSLNSPIFVVEFERTSSLLNKLYGQPEVRINCPLKGYEFYRQLDIYTAYQELSMYVGGVLRRAEPICVEVSDLTMRDKKGFDEWSFKTRPKEAK